MGATGATRLAEELNGQSLGREIEFRWEFPRSKVKATIIGELREVSHDGRDVTVEITGPDAPDGETTQFTLQPGVLVILRPVE